MYYYHAQANWNQLIKEADYAKNFYYTMDPMSAPIDWYKGVALFSSGDINSAKMAFESACAIHPNNIHVLNNLGSCYESLKQHDKAEEYYLKALNISSGFEEARLNLSAVYFNAGKFEKAFETIDKCSPYCDDEKYKTFLPAILNARIDVVIAKEKDPATIEKLKKLRVDSNLLVNTYVDCKKKDEKFVVN
jgi:tetratricopeptide (TPR) repeat protein